VIAWCPEIPGGWTDSIEGVQEAQRFEGAIGVSPGVFDIPGLRSVFGTPEKAASEVKSKDSADAFFTIDPVEGAELVKHAKSIVGIADRVGMNHQEEPVKGFCVEIFPTIVGGELWKDLAFENSLNDGSGIEFAEEVTGREKV
jgi:hypothetical protein